MSEELFSESYLIKQAGSKAGKQLIIGAMLEKVAGTKIAHDQYGVLNVGAHLLSNLHDPKDIQVALHNIEFHYDSGEDGKFDLREPGKTVAVFLLRCPVNPIYGNQTSMQRWPDFFEDVLGFEKHIHKMNNKNIAEGNNWFANFRDVLNPEHSNKTFDYFEVAVPLAGLLEKLNIDPETYATLVKQAEDNEAREKSHTLAPERLPHSLGGLKKIPVVAAKAPPPAEESAGFFGKLKKMFG